MPTRMPKPKKRQSSARRVSVSKSQGKLVASLVHTKNSRSNRATLKRKDEDLETVQTIVYAGDRMPDVNEHGESRVISSKSDFLTIEIRLVNSTVSNRLAYFARKHKVKLGKPTESLHCELRSVAGSYSGFEYAVKRDERISSRVTFYHGVKAAESTGTDQHARESHVSRCYEGDGKPSRHKRADGKPNTEEMDRWEQYAENRTGLDSHKR